MHNYIFILFLLFGLSLHATEETSQLVCKKDPENSAFARFSHRLKCISEIGYTQILGIADIYPNPLQELICMEYRPGYGKSAFVMHRLSGLTVAVLHMMTKQKEQKIYIGISQFGDEVRLLSLLDQVKPMQNLSKAALLLFKKCDDVRYFNQQQERVNLAIQDTKTVVVPYMPVSGSLYRDKDHFIYELSSKGGCFKLTSGEQVYSQSVDLLDLKAES